METQPFFAAIATLPALPRVECSAEMDLNEMETQPMFPVSPAHFLSFYLAFFCFCGSSWPIKGNSIKAQFIRNLNSMNKERSSNHKKNPSRRKKNKENVKNSS